MPDPIAAAVVKPAAPPPVEPPKPETQNGAPPAEEQLSPADIKAKNELRKEMQRVSEMRTNFLREKEAWNKEREEARREEAMLAVDPDAFMKKRLGDKWYETLTKAKLGDDSNLAVQQLRQELEARFKAQEDERAKAAAEAEQQANEERERLAEEARVSLEEYRAEATAFVKEKSDEYQVINALGLESSIADKTQTHYQQTKKVLSHKEAADLLESELDKAIEKVLGTKKWQEKLGKQEPAKPNQPPQLVRPPSGTTIDNGMRAGVAPQNQRPTREEKLQRAMARLDEWEKAKAQQ